MTEEAIIETVLLAPDEAMVAAIEQIAQTQFVTADYTLCVELLRGEPAEAVAAARRTHGGIPLGVATADEADALEAIAAGADEAMVIAEVDHRHVVELLERTRLRASLRRERERVQASAAQSEKLAALGTVVAGVAHEINNPLAAVLLSIDALRAMVAPLLAAATRLEEALDGADAGGAVPAAVVAELLRVARAAAPEIEPDALFDELLANVQSIADVVRDLRVFARSDRDDKPEIVRAPDVIDQVLRIVGREITSHGVIERDYAGEVPPLVVPRTRLVQVITNILVNAAHAIREIERPVHRVRIAVRADDEAVAISVSDTGPGIPPDALDQIFDPFFTTKREEVGTGLGLSISRSILRRLGGDLVVESVHGDGATFIALLPLPERAALRAAYLQPNAVVGAAPAVRRRIKVLVVDDDQRVLRAFARALRDRCDVLLASDGQEAVELLASGSEAEVVIADPAVPELDGPALHAWLQRERPALAERMLFVVEPAAASAYAEFLRGFGDRVLQKPVSKQVLVRAIDAVRRP